MYCILTYSEPCHILNSVYYCKFKHIQVYSHHISGLELTLKWLGMGGGVCGFSKNVSSKERVKLWFFVTFNIIISHIFPENFIEITTQVVQKIWRICLTILANFHWFASIFWIFWHFFVMEKLMTSTYNKWCQHFLLSTYFK